MTDSPAIIEAQPTSSGGAGRHRSRRKPLPRWKRLLIGVGALSVVAGSAICMSMQSPMQISSVVITGASADLQPQVASALAISDGQSFSAVDVGAVKQRITAIDGIKGADLHWTWWNTLTVDVNERTPVGLLADPSGAFVVVDADGAAMRTVPARPTGLMVVQAGDDAGRAQGLKVAQQVPADMAAAADSIVVDGPEAISMRMLNGATVLLGGSGDVAAKLQLAQQLLAGTGAKVVNVSVPQRPAVSDLPPPPKP